MPTTTRAAAKLKKLQSSEQGEGKICDCENLKVLISEERSRRIAAEDQLKKSLENERILEIVHRELDLEKSRRIIAEGNFRSLLQKIPSHVEQRKEAPDVLKENAEIDVIGEGRGGQKIAERHMASLDIKSKMEVLCRELDIERSWRKTCQENLHALIQRIPFDSTANESQMASDSKEGEEMKRADEMKNALAQSEFRAEANKEIERLTQLCSSLSEKNNSLKSAHDTDLAVHEEFRIWVESQNFCQDMSFREFKAEDIDQLIKDQHQIGSGGFGNVYKAVLGNASVAVKIVKDNGTQGSREYYTEVEILRKIHHPNVIHLIGACTDKKALVYEYLGNGTLETLLKDKEAATWFTWQARINVALQICSALIFLHSIRPKPVVHGDLKPENIMFNDLNIPKIGDFGISHELYCTTNTGTWEHFTKGMPRGSSSYVDPEFENTCKLTPFADVYAFGVILLQLVTGQHAMGLVDLVQHKLMSSPNLKSKGDEMQQNILKKLGLIDKNLHDLKLDPRAVLLVLQLGLACAKKDRHERPSLSAGVWPKLYVIKCQCESSCAVQ